MNKLFLFAFLPGAIIGFCNGLGIAEGFEVLMRQPFDPIGDMVAHNFGSMFRLSSVPAAFFVGLFTTLLDYIRYVRPSELIGAAASALASTFVITPYGEWGMINVFIMILWTPIGTAVGWIAGKIVGAFLSRKAVDGQGPYWNDF